MVTKQIYWVDFQKNVLPWFSDLSTSAVKKSGRSDQYCGLYIVQGQKNKQTDGQTDRQTAVTNILGKNRRFSQSNEAYIPGTLHFRSRSTPERIRGLYDGLPKRVRAVIMMRGYTTKY